MSYFLRVALSMLVRLMDLLWKLKRPAAVVGEQVWISSQAAVTTMMMTIQRIQKIQKMTDVAAVDPCVITLILAVIIEKARVMTLVSRTGVAVRARISVHQRVHAVRKKGTVIDKRK